MPHHPRPIATSWPSCSTSGPRATPSGSAMAWSAPRFREGMEHPSLIEPGRIYAYDIDCWNTSQLFKKGHRIRLEIASSGFPKYDRNPNTGAPLGQSSETKTADQTIYHDRDHPSHVILPIVVAKP